MRSCIRPVACSRLNPAVPARLEEIIDKSLEKDRDKRYRSAAELLAELDDVKQHTGKTLPRWILQYAPGTAVALILMAGAWIGLTRSGLFRAQAPAAIDSIAVLPFVNGSNNPNAEYLSDGIAESLIDSLAQLPKLRVIPRTTAFRFKKSDGDAEKFGRNLHVRAVLTGRVIERGDSLSVQVDLIDVDRASQLWGQQYNRKLSDIFAVQEEIAREISARLRLKLSGEEKQKLVRRPTENTQAYNYYVRGRYFWGRRSEESLKQAIDWFQRAIDQDPAYALPYTGIADCYSSLTFSFDTGTLPPKEGMPKAKAAAAKALEIDDSLAEAHTSLAFIRLLYDWDWSGAESEFRKAISLNPNYGNAHHWYSHHLTAVGRERESLAEAKRALELEPLEPVMALHLGWHYYYARQYDLALEQLKRGLAMDPKFGSMYSYLGWVYRAKGMYPEALADLRKAKEFLPKPEVDTELALTYADLNQKEKTRQVLDELKKQAKRVYVSPYYLAVIHAALGEKDQAFEWLEKGYRDRADLMVYVRVEPRLDSLRSDSRFPALIKKVGLPD